MEQLVFIKEGKAVTDTLRIAEEFQKEHRNVLADVENQINKLEQAGEKEWGLLNFQHTQYQHPQNKQWYPKIDMTEEGFALVAMAYVTPETMKMKVRFIEEFKHMRLQLQPSSSMTTLEILAQLTQQAVEKERADVERDREVKSLRNGLDTLTDNLTAVPDAAKVRDLLNEYHRWTRLEFDEIYNSIYETLLDQHGIDVKRRVSNERDRIDAEYFAKTGRHYAIATLKKNVTGIDVMVRMGVLDKFHTILVGMLAKAKGNRIF